jgi:hypothetical protein
LSLCLEVIGPIGAAPHFGAGAWARRKEDAMVSPKRAQTTTRKPKARERRSSFARWKELLKRPGTWILGLVGAAAGFYAMTFMETTKPPFMEMMKPLSRYVSELTCEFRKPNRSSDEARFTILVSPLADDDADRSHTRRVLETFYGERGFLPVVLCETLSFGLAEGAETEPIIKRGEDLIVAHQADLLIFGSVISPKNSIKIWAINEHGGCDLRPKPITLRHGNLPDDFDHETKLQLIAVTLREIASACRNQASVDWGLFEKRIQRMGPFIEYSIAGLSTERSRKSPPPTRRG